MACVDLDATVDRQPDVCPRCAIRTNVVLDTGQDRVSHRFLAVVVYAGLLVLLYVLTARGGAREIGGTVLAPLVPFAKSAYFFSVTVAYFLGAAVVYLLVAQALAKGQADPSVNVMTLLGEVPGWVYALVCAAWLLLITVYFAPGDAEANKIELRAFTVLLVAALLAAGGGYLVWKIWKLQKLPFWKQLFGGS